MDLLGRGEDNSSPENFKFFSCSNSSTSEGLWYFLCRMMQFLDNSMNSDLVLVEQAKRQCPPTNSNMCKDLCAEAISCVLSGPGVKVR